MRISQMFSIMESNRFLVERDVANAKEIKSWVKTVTQNVADPNAKTWMISQLNQFLINRVQDASMVMRVSDAEASAPGSPEWLKQKIQTGSPVFKIRPTDEFARKVAEVIDWINDWSAENPGSRINFTWEQAVAASDRWHRELARQGQHGEETFDHEGIAVIREYPNGFRWVDVRTSECLSREGGRMGHCVGSYHRNVSSGETRIFSLRDAKNRPHVTIEISDPHGPFWDQQIADHAGGSQKSLPLVPTDSGTEVGSVEQIKGKENKAPVGKYVPYVKDFLTVYPVDYTYGGERDLETMGMFLRDGKLVGLKDVSKVLKTYPSGHMWVGLSLERQYQTDSRIHLVDAKWDVKFTGRAYGTDSEIKKVSSFEVDGVDPTVNGYVLDLLNGGLESVGISAELNSAQLYEEMGIVRGKRGYSTDPSEVSDVHPIMDGEYKIITLWDLHNNSYMYNRGFVPYIMDSNNTVVGNILIGDVHNKIKQIRFENDIGGERYARLAQEVSAALGLELANKTFFDTTRLIEKGEDYGQSSNDEYDYVGVSGVNSTETEYIYVLSDKALLWLIVHDRAQNRLDWHSPRFSSPGLEDRGQLGYVLLDLIEQGILDLEFSQELLRDTLLRLGWWEDSRGNSTYFISGADKWLRVNVHTHREGEPDQEDIKPLGEVGEELWGSSDEEHIATEIADFLTHKVYNKTDEGYDEGYDDGDGDAVYEDITITPVNNEDVRWFEYTTYSEAVISSKNQKGWA